ncbi:DUF805 domain-containing protein [Bdellovibrio sp. HCB209]|uniref:DUF805 domain-containing protein n=1 Tax=Bdellovibrio sp. HCB209 TaxID=3394354 RepID=UPI0039B6C907
MEWYVEVLSKYAVFSGRARRKEFWMFFLVSFCVAIAVGVAEKLFKIPNFGNVYQLAVLVPSIAVGARRMHDINKSGWWQLVPIYSFYLMCKEGDHLPNEYGSNPKDDTPDTHVAA